MTDSQETQGGKTPWHLWAVGIFALLWSAMGALDFVMTQTGNEDYLSNFTQEQVEYFSSFPAWVVATWAVAVWGGVIGAILLLLRKSIAVWVFLASLVSMVITSFQNYVLSNGMEVAGDTFSLVFTAIIFLLSLGFYLYSMKLKRQGAIN